MTPARRKSLSIFGVVWIIGGMLMVLACHPPLKIALPVAAALVTATVLSVRHCDAYEVGKTVGRAMEREGASSR